MKILSVFDKVAQTYDIPFFKLNAAVAQREFHMACQNEQSLYNQFPSDYELHELGEFNQTDGTFKIRQQLITVKTEKGEEPKSQCKPLIICQAIRPQTEENHVQ